MLDLEKIRQEWAGTPTGMPNEVKALVEEVERLRYALREIADSLSHDDLEGAQDTCGAFADLIESGSGADHE